MNVIDNKAIAQNISDGIAQLQAAGMALEDHLPSVIQAAVDAELLKIETMFENVLDAAAVRLSTILNDALDRLNGASVSRGVSADARAILGEIVLTIPPSIKPPQS